jgi:hypothetical protein
MHIRGICLHICIYSDALQSNLESKKLCSLPTTWTDILTQPQVHNRYTEWFDHRLTGCCKLPDRKREAMLAFYCSYQLSISMDNTQSDWSHFSSAMNWGELRKPEVPVLSVVKSSDPALIQPPHLVLTADCISVVSFSVTLTDYCNICRQLLNGSESVFQNCNYANGWLLIRPVHVCMAQTSA